MIARILFAIRHGTLKPIAKSDDPAFLDVYHDGETVRMKRRCSHQGAPLEEGYIRGDYLFCSWHGCRLSLKNASETPGAYDPTAKPA